MRKDARQERICAPTARSQETVCPGRWTAARHNATLSPMRTRHLALATAPALACLLASVPAAQADEGQWTPDQIGKLDADMLRKKGLQLKAEELWDEKGGGVMRAAVNLSGCSASFISAKGLVITNNHCAVSAIQSQSTEKNNYLRDGFLAKDQKSEIEAKGKTVRVLDEITDVTEKVLAAAKGASDDTARAKAVSKVRKELVKACEEKDPARRCNVAEFYNGSLYRLFAYTELRDLRIVYAPPRSVGNYGGEIDNWMWPRHAGDFTVFRAYVSPEGKPADYAEANVPYEPKTHLKVSGNGVKPGDFVAILGYPGRTNRYLPAAEVQRYLEQVFPARIEIYGEWIDILEKLGAEDESIRIKVASKLRSMANRHKNARGMVDGITRMKLLDRRKDEETKLREKDGAAEILDGLSGLSAKERATFRRDFLLSSFGYGPRTLSLALDLVRRAKEKQKPDLERVSSHMDRNDARMWKAQERKIRDYDPTVELALMTSFLEHLQKLEGEQAVPAVAGLRPDRLVKGTKLTDKATVEALWKAADPAAIEASRDPMIVLARGLVESIEAMEAEERKVRGQMLTLGPRYFKLLEEVRTGPVYPDANSTLRFSYATVQGYSPRDGLTATPQTTLAGLVDKHTGEEPFDVPARILEAAGKPRGSYWVDPGMGDVPINFLSNGDTTGGNSGSPVINGKGELVGLNFDRVWENIAGDFGYNIPRSRNVSVDIRYLLWMLDKVEDAGWLLDELELGHLRNKPARKAHAPDHRREGATLVAGVKEKKGAKDGAGADGCACSSTPDGNGNRLGALGLMGLMAVGLRRRRN